MTGHEKGAYGVRSCLEKEVISYEQQVEAIDKFTVVPLGTGNAMTPSSPNGFGTCSTVSSKASLTS